MNLSKFNEAFSDIYIIYIHRWFSDKLKTYLVRTDFGMATVLCSVLCHNLPLSAVVAPLFISRPSLCSSEQRKILFDFRKFNACKCNNDNNNNMYRRGIRSVSRVHRKLSSLTSDNRLSQQISVQLSVQCKSKKKKYKYIKYISTDSVVM